MYVYILTLYKHVLCEMAPTCLNRQQVQESTNGSLLYWSHWTAGFMVLFFCHQHHGLCISWNLAL